MTGPPPPLSEGLDLPLTSGGSREGARGPGPPSFLDQNEAQRAEKNFFEAGPPPYLTVWMTRAPPLSEGMDRH